MQNGPAGSGLAAARFAHQAEGLSLVNLEADPIHRFYMAFRSPEYTFFDGEPYLEVFDFQHGFAFGVDELVTTARTHFIESFFSQCLF